MIAARVPDQTDQYLTHPYGMFWEEVRDVIVLRVIASTRLLREGV